MNKQAQVQVGDIVEYYDGMYGYEPNIGAIGVVERDGDENYVGVRWISTPVHEYADSKIRQWKKCNLRVLGRADDVK